MRDFLTDEELAKLDPVTRYGVLTSRHLAAKHCATVLSSALFSRLCRDGRRDLAFRVIRLLDDTAGDVVADVVGDYRSAPAHAKKLDETD